MLWTVQYSNFVFLNTDEIYLCFVDGMTLQNLDDVQQFQSSISPQFQ